MVKPKMEGTDAQEDEACLSFFKFYYPDYSSEKLHIPPAFVLELSRKLPEKAFLRSPLGRLWHVELIEIKGDMYFQNGWVQFVEDNKLELGDFLVFRFNGNSIFDFKLYGTSSCEKHMCEGDVSNFYGKCTVKEEKEEESEVKEDLKTEKEDYLDKGVEEFDEDEDEDEDDDDDDGGDGDDDDDDDDDDYEGDEEDDDEDDEIDEDEVEEDANDERGDKEQPIRKSVMKKQLGSRGKHYGLNAVKVQKSAVKAETSARVKSKTKSRKVPATRGRGLQITGIKVENQHAASNVHNEQFAAFRRHDIVESLSRKTHVAKSPSIKVTMKPSYVTGRKMHLPTGFSFNYLRRGEGFINLQTPDGRVWNAYCISDNGRRTTITRGWRAFASDNSLKEGDVCVFEWLTTRDITLKVSILQRGKFEQ